MVFDMRGTRERNTRNDYNYEIYRLFIGGKLFVDDAGKTCFETPDEAWNAFFGCSYWAEVVRYIDYSAGFFEKEGDEEWKNDFENEILKKLNITVTKYTPVTDYEQ